jgi:beta-1,4-mannosyltransferase
MRVAFVPIWPENPYHRELKKALNRLGVEVWLPKSVKSAYKAYREGRDKLDILHLHALPCLERSPAGLIRFPLFYRRVNWLRKRGVRVVWTIHDLQNHDSKFLWIENRVAYTAFHGLDALIVHGNTAKQLVEKRWGRRDDGRVYVIPHGNYIHSYENKISREAARAALGLDPGHLVFLFLGNIRPYKGVEEMIEAFKVAANGRARLVIAGLPGNEAIRLEVERSIQSDLRIRFVPGYVKDQDIQTYMNACDVVVFPYKRILTSGAVVLAMSFGKPCIAPQDGCVPDMLDGKGAVFFNPSAQEDLERAFLQISGAQSDLAEMGRHNLQRALVWDWDVVAHQTALVYERCMAAHEPAGNSAVAAGNR